MEGVNAADVGVLLALVWLVVRLEWTRSENAAAHAAIIRSIHGLKEDVKRLLSGDIARMRAVLQDRQPRQ